MCWVHAIVPGEVHMRDLRKPSKGMPKILNGQKKQAQWLVTSMFQNRMVFVICIMCMWI
jgi:hypothetical protein